MKLTDNSLGGYVNGVQPIPEFVPPANRPVTSTPDVGILHTHPYIQGRGVPVEVAQEFGIGVYNNRVLFPVHDLYGNFVHYVPRVMDNTDPKYDFSGLAKSMHVYNYHRARQARRKALIIVEGFIDTVKVHMAGYPSVVALMGSAMSASQESYILRWWEYIILMMDGDKSGREAQEEHYKRFKKQDLKGLFKINLPDKVQPDQLNTDQIRQALSSPVQ